MCGGDQGGAYRRGYGSMAQIMAICGLSIQRHFVLNPIHDDLSSLMERMQNSAVYAKVSFF